MRHILLLLLCCCMSMVYGATTANQLNALGGIIEPPIDWSAFPKPAKLGKYTDELKHPQTKEFIMKFLMVTPETLPTEAHLGLVLCFHGQNGNETHLGPAVADSMKAAGLGNNYIVISLKSKGAGWANDDERLVLQTIDWLKSVYPIDPRRVFIWGMSNGGWMVSTFGGKHQDTIAGIVRYCGYIPTAPNVPNAAETQTEYYLVHGDADTDVNVSGSRNLRLSLQQNKYRYVYREIAGGGHVDIFSNKPVREDICRWIDSLRHKQVPLHPDEIAFLKQLSDKKKADALLKKPNTWEEILRIGGPHAGVVLAQAFKSESTAIRQNAAVACTKGVFAGDETITSLIKLTDEKNVDLRQAAIKALGMYANWHYPDAQMALGKIALKPKGETTDRGAAVTVLAAAATFPLLGNYQDDVPVFQALVMAMDDDLKPLREVAFAPLHAAVKDGLGYDPTMAKKDRATSVAKWMEWFEQRAKPAENQAKR